MSRRSQAWPTVRAMTLVLVVGAAALGASQPSITPLDLTPQSEGDAGRGTLARASVSPVTAALQRSVLSCPGPEQQGLDDETVSVREQPQEVRVLAGAAPDELLTGLGAGPTGQLVLRPSGGTSPQRTTERDGGPVSVNTDDAESVTAEARDGLAPALAATQRSQSTKEQRRGLELTPCLAPEQEAWLLAGGSEPGRAERLVLTNPGANPVSVDVEVLGADGPVETSGGTGLVVPPGGRSVVLLDALAPEVSAPAVRVISTGGPVAAALGDRWLEGSTDRGLELTVPTAAPQTTQVVPAVTGVRSRGSISLRLGVPGDTEAVVQVRALTPDGPQALDNDVTSVPGGTTRDVDLSDLPNGVHGLQVTSDVPVLAGAVSQRSGAEPEQPSGLAWSPATEELTTTTAAGVVLAGGGVEQAEGTHVLVLSALEEAEVEVVTVDADGTVRTDTRSVPAASDLVTNLEDAASVWVRPTDGGVHAAVLARVDDPEGGPLVATLPLVPSPLYRDIAGVAPDLP